MVLIGQCANPKFMTSRLILSQRIVVWTLKEMDGEWKIADVMSDGSSWLLSEFNCEEQ